MTVSITSLGRPWLRPAVVSAGVIAAAVVVVLNWGAIVSALVSVVVFGLFALLAVALLLRLVLGRASRGIGPLIVAALVFAVARRRR